METTKVTELDQTFQMKFQIDVGSILTVLFSKFNINFRYEQSGRLRRGRKLTKEAAFECASLTYLTIDSLKP